MKEFMIFYTITLIVSIIAATLLIILMKWLYEKRK